MSANLEDPCCAISYRIGSLAEARARMSIASADWALRLAAGARGGAAIPAHLPESDESDTDSSGAHDAPSDTEQEPNSNGGIGPSPAVAKEHNMYVGHQDEAVKAGSFGEVRVGSRSENAPWGAKDVAREERGRLCANSPCAQPVGEDEQVCMRCRKGKDALVSTRPYGGHSEHVRAMEDANGNGASGSHRKGPDTQDGNTAQPWRAGLPGSSSKSDACPGLAPAPGATPGSDAWPFVDLSMAKNLISQCSMGSLPPDCKDNFRGASIRHIMVRPMLLVHATSALKPFTRACIAWVLHLQVHCQWILSCLCF